AAGAHPAAAGPVPGDAPVLHVRPDRVQALHVAAARGAAAAPGLGGDRDSRHRGVDRRRERPPRRTRRGRRARDPRGARVQGLLGEPRGDRQDAQARPLAVGEGAPHRRPVQGGRRRLSLLHRPQGRHHQDRRREGEPQGGRERDLRAAGDPARGGDRRSRRGARSGDPRGRRRRARLGPHRARRHRALRRAPRELHGARRGRVPRRAAAGADGQDPAQPAAGGGRAPGARASRRRRGGGGAMTTLLDIAPALAFSAHALDIDPEDVAGDIAAVLREQVLTRLRRRGVVVGLSGGVDSSVVAALSVRALGAEHVFGLFTPEQDSEPDSLRLGRLVAETFGVESALEDITPILAAAGCYRRRDEFIREVFPEYTPEFKCKLVLPDVLAGRGYNVHQLVIESPDGTQHRARPPLHVALGIVAATNMKQRTRKQIEYYHADRLSYAVAGTPNRLEYDQGFFVKNGDGAADVK